MLSRLAMLLLLASAYLCFGHAEAQTNPCFQSLVGSCDAGQTKFQIAKRATQPTCPAGARAEVCPNRPIEAEVDCYNVFGGVTCDGWVRETETAGKLAYEWNITVDGVPSVLTGQNVTVACELGQTVAATLTVRNGTGRGDASAEVYCDPAQVTPLAPYGPNVDWAGCYGRNNVYWTGISGNEEFYILQKRTLGTTTWQTVQSSRSSMAQIEVSYSTDIRVASCNWHGCSSWKYGPRAEYWPQCPNP